MVSCTTRPRPATGRRHACSWQHYAMVEAFRAAREAWEQKRERASNGWPVEERQFRAANPCPRLRDFMGSDAHLAYETHRPGDDDDDRWLAPAARQGDRLAS